MNKERKKQATKLLLQFQGEILTQQGKAIHNDDEELYNKLYEAWALLEDIMNLIDEATEDD